MQESKDPKATEPFVGTEDDDAKADATSSETLSDVEENEIVSEERDESGSSAPLSPDGTMNYDDGERSPADDADPL